MSRSQPQQCPVPACAPASPISRQSIIIMIVMYLLISCHCASLSALNTVGMITRCPTTYRELPQDTDHHPSSCPFLSPVIFHLSPLSLSLSYRSPTSLTLLPILPGQPSGRIPGAPFSRRSSPLSFCPSPTSITLFLSDRTAGSRRFSALEQKVLLCGQNERASSRVVERRCT